MTSKTVTVTEDVAIWA